MRFEINHKLGVNFRDIFWLTHARHYGVVYREDRRLWEWGRELSVKILAMYFFPLTRQKKRRKKQSSLAS